jgi:hypothetical protein
MQWTDLPPATRYSIAIAASNSVGVGRFSNWSTAVSTCGVPASPSITSVSGSDGAVSVSWDASSSSGCLVTQYVIVLQHVGGNSSDRHTLNRTITASSTTYTWTGLPSGEEYEVGIAANNSVGVGPLSDWSAAVSTCDVPSAPSLVSVVAGDACRGGLQVTTAGVL